MRSARVSRVRGWAAVLSLAVGVQASCFFLDDGPPGADCPAGSFDCNDGNPGIYPGAEEVCGSVLDRDCDGVSGYSEPACLDSGSFGCANKDGGSC